MSRSLALLLVLVFLTVSSLVVFKPVSSADVVENSWASKAPMHVARSGLGVAVVNGKIYAIGGSTRSGGGGTRSGPLPSTGGVVGTNEEYDPATDTWTFKAPMPTPRDNFGIAVYNNKVYCIGGLGGVNEVYDTETDTWENKTSMPTLRWALQANVVNGKIYLIGGYVPDDSAFGGSISAVNEAYDPASDTWTTKMPAPIATSDYPSAVVDNKIYITGGLSSAPESNLNQIYDPATDTWSQGALMPLGVRYGAAGATIGVNALKRIYSISEFAEWSGTQVYDPLNDKWTSGEHMPTRREGFAVAVMDDVLYVIGGYSTSYPDMPYSYPYGPSISVYATNEQYTPFGYGAPDPSYDGTAPEVTVSSSENKTYYTTDLALNFNVNEPVSSIRYELDGENAVEISGNITLMRLSFGAHNLTVYATDASGNVGSSEVIIFTVAESEPFLAAPVAAASVAIVASVFAGVIIYFKKLKH
jgi:N-acetylneuraminic acid mutarotase